MLGRVAGGAFVGGCFLLGAKRGITKREEVRKSSNKLAKELFENHNDPKFETPPWAAPVQSSTIDPVPKP
jgi:hypothetical protein